MTNGKTCSALLKAQLTCVLGIFLGGESQTTAFDPLDALGGRDAV